MRISVLLISVTFHRTPPYGAALSTVLVRPGTAGYRPAGIVSFADEQ